jgi:hypothetical protein
MYLSSADLAALNASITNVNTAISNTTTAIATVADSNTKTALTDLNASLSAASTSLQLIVNALGNAVDTSTHLTPSDPHTNGSEIVATTPSSDPTQLVELPNRTSGAFWARPNFTGLTFANNAFALSGATHNVSYSLQLTGANGYVGDSLSFAVNANTPLPAGLTLSGAGLLSGTPTTAGTYNFIITLTDQHGNSDSKWFMLVIA